MPGASGGPRREAGAEARVTPPWPLRLPRRRGPDGVLRVRGGLVERLLQVEGRPVLARAWEEGGDVRLLADALDPATVERPGAPPSSLDGERAGRDQLELAIERMRFALGVDEDLRPFYERFRGDRLLGTAIRRRPWMRPRRRPWPWEALAWAIVNQLIEAERALAIQRRIVRRWGASLDLALDGSGAAHPDGGARADVLRDVPTAELIAGRAPAELTAMDLAPSRALTLVRAAREVAAGRAALSDPACDRRLLAVPGVGPWTVQCVGLHGRGDPDSLPAGDLAYLKLVGRLAELGRRATVEEVEEFFRPYEPYRGLAGSFVLAEYHRRVASGPPLRRAA